VTFRLALRALASRPVRSAVLACGFGFGIAVMAALLGVGEVILDQAQAPALRGGGDLLVTGVNGKLDSARFVFSSVLATPPLENRAAASSPSLHGRLYLVTEKGTVPLQARGGIPSLERAIGDPETASVGAWVDAPGDARWSSPDPGDVLRAMDRFHAIPGSPRATSWAEWLYFNGREGETKFYLTFLFGPRNELGNRVAGVRLQLDRDGKITNYTDTSEISEALLASAPDVEIGRCSVRLEGLRYRIALAFPGLTGDLAIDADPGRSLAPVVLRGADDWISGYVVPVLSGKLNGTLRTQKDDISFDGGTGYHDHNWGFWEGVSWQWGQVAGDGISIVYGRVRPPADVADPARIPGFLGVLGPNGPEAFSTRVTIDETDDPTAGHPKRIVVDAHGQAIELRMEIDVESAVHTPWTPGAAGGPLDALSLVQMRGSYRVVGRVAGRSVSFSAVGSAETFR